MKNDLAQYPTEMLSILYLSQIQIVGLTRKCVRAARKWNDVEMMQQYEKQLEEQTGDLLRIGVALLTKNPKWDHNNLTDLLGHPVANFA
jgi:hypothetical protein